MRNESESRNYMFLMRGADWDRGIPSDDVTFELDRMMAWVESLDNNGTLLSGRPLIADGRVVTASRTGLVTDGPFTETKEAVGGYLIIRAADLRDAVKIAYGCPALKHGLQIEVRPIVHECPITSRIQKSGDRVELSAAGSTPLT